MQIDQDTLRYERLAALGLAWMAPLLRIARPDKSKPTGRFGNRTVHTTGRARLVKRIPRRPCAAVPVARLQGHDSHGRPTHYWVMSTGTYRYSLPAGVDPRKDLKVHQFPRICGASRRSQRNEYAA